MLRVTCSCGKSSKTEDGNAGRRAKCPSCGDTIVFPALPATDVEGAESKVALNGLKTACIALVILAAVTGGWAIWSTMEARDSKREEAEMRSVLAAARIEIARANERVTQAKLVEQRGNQARKEAEQIRLREEGRLHEIYPDLRRLEVGINRVDERYLKEFDYSPSKVKVTLVNKADRPVKPRFTITLLNKEGFVTEDVYITWLATEIGPGETRLDEQGVRLDVGDPVYYLMRFGSY
jgi:hypothetical protein